MAKSIRQDEILQLLEKDGFVSTSQMAAHYGVSIETIRRDLDIFEKRGIATKVYGGAKLTNSQPSPWPSYDVRMESFPDAKMAIAVQALTHIPGSCTIALDVGSTITEFCKQLIHRDDLIVICNDIQCASLLFKAGKHQIYVLGGFLSDVGSTSGAFIREFFSTISDIDYYVCSTDGISLEGGLTTNRERTNDLKRQYIRKAKSTIVLADHSKFTQRGFYKLCELSDIDLLITDSATPGELVEKIRQSGVPVEIAEN